MSKEQTCAVVTFLQPGKEAQYRQAKNSIDQAIEFGGGPFTRIMEIPISNHDGEWSEARMHNGGVTAAQEQKADWIFFLHAGEALNRDAFVIAEPSLRLFDAVWGAASLFEGDQLVERVTKKSRLACQRYEDFFHLALRWWIGRSHFIKTRVAEKLLCEDDDEMWFQKYQLTLWERHPCMKSAQPLTALWQPPKELNGSERQYLLRYLDDNPVFLSVHVDGQEIKLPYTGRNPVIEREQTRGAFFEQEELEFLISRLSPGGTIVDVGANTGNHTVFFSRFADPAEVIPIEPAPNAITALKRSVEKNRLDNVDLSKLGVGAGAERGSCDLDLSERGGLGATRLKANTEGSVQVYPLDDLLDGPVDFLKIDVESMEMQVLEGAERLISQCRPSIFVEIIDDNIQAFLQWIDAHHYRIEKIFPDKTHANYFIVADDPGAGRE